MTSPHPTPLDGVFRKYLPAMRGIARTLTRDDPDDIVQDTIVNLLSANKIDPNKAAISYFYKAMRYTILSRAKKRETQRRMITELMARCHMGMTSQELYGVKEPEYRAIHLAQQLRKEHRKLAIAEIEARIDLHRRRCKYCRRGIPNMLTYCSELCKTRSMSTW